MITSTSRRERMKARMTLFCLFLMVIGCGDNTAPKSQKNEAESEDTPLSRVEDTYEEEAAISDTDLALPPEGAPIEKRIEASIGIANRVYAGLARQRENLFVEAFEQGQTVLCAAHRLERLSHQRSADFHISRVQPFLFVVRNSLLGQRFLKVLEDRQDHGSYKDVSVYFSITMAKPYRDDATPLADYRLYQGRSPSGVIFHVNLRYVCGAAFMAPIPNFKSAKDLEAKSVATVIARSVRRLAKAPERLKTIEDGCSKANALRLILSQLRRDLEYDAEDPSVAKEKMRDYERDLRQAVRLLRGPEVKEAYAIPKSEVERVLSLFQYKVASE